MAESISKLRKRLLTAVSCGLLGMVPLVGGCIEAKPAYGMPVNCETHPLSCTDNQFCENECGTDWYCEFPQDADAGTRGTCTEPQP